MWGRYAPSHVYDRTNHLIVWPLLIAEHPLILLLCSGLLTWAVRRERRRKAAEAA